MTERERLPNRRLNISFNFRWAGMDYVATIGRFQDGGLSEIVLSNGKCNTDSDTIARDAGVVCSLALQHGCDLETIRGALLRDSRGAPSGPLGCALDLVASMDSASNDGAAE